MNEIMEYLRFADGFHMGGAIIRMLLAVICGGIIGIEREYKRRPAGFRTHILICLGASLTMLTSQYIYLELQLFTDLARLGAQVIAGIGFIGAGTIIVTKRIRVKGLTTAAGLWASAIVGLAIGAGVYEAALIATLMIILVELVLLRIEIMVNSTARDMNLYVEYKASDTLESISQLLRDNDVQVISMHITKSASLTQSPCVIISLSIPKKMSHDIVMTSLARLDGVLKVEEL